MFGANVAEQYERGMVPLLFTPFAQDLARRVAQERPKRVLEVAAGTGAVTRELVKLLPDATIVATDLHPAMIEHGKTIVPGVEWRIADAQALPFDAASFDAIACQFGVMFFPDRVVAFRGMRRIAPRLWFSTWDSLKTNLISQLVNDAVVERFPGIAPTFIERIPHGYFDEAQIRADLAAAGWGTPQIARVAFTTRAPSPEMAARALVAGTPMRNEIDARDPGGLDAAVAFVAERLRAKLGPGAIEGAMTALVVTATAAAAD